MIPCKTPQFIDYQPQKTEVKEISLQAHLEKALHQYLSAFEETPVRNLYHTLLDAIEPTLFKVTLQACKTQEAAASMLGLSRGTLRKKLKKYHIE